MMVIYEQTLPESYLLIVAPGAECADAALLPGLRRACQSHKPAVWVDCRLLDAASPTEANILLNYDYILRQHHARLVLCRVSEGLEQELQRAGTACPRIVPTLQDAA